MKYRIPFVIRVQGAESICPCETLACQRIKYDYVDCEHLKTVRVPGGFDWRVTYEILVDAPTLQAAIHRAKQRIDFTFRDCELEPEFNSQFREASVALLFGDAGAKSHENTWQAIEVLIPANTPNEE